MSTALTRAAKRDYWNRLDVVRNCQRLDYALGVFALCALMALGSLFN